MPVGDLQINAAFQLDELSMVMIPPPIYYALFLSTVVLLALWAVTATYLNRTGVRADEITDDEIILSPVSSEFFDLVGYERSAKTGPNVPPWDEYDPYPRADAAAGQK